MKQFFQSYLFKITVALVVVALGLLIAAGASGRFENLSDGVVGFLVKPFQDIGTSVGDGLATFFSDLFSGAEYRAEKEALQQEVNELRNQLAEYDNALRENANYKEYLGLAEENPDWQLVAASVVERDPTSPYGDLKINKGSLHGIKERDVVITADGLVGVVSSVGWTYSKVQTVLNPALSVGCICSRTGDTGLLCGELALAPEGFTAIGYIDKTSGIRAGDYIITGGSELFPASLVVGRVQKIGADESGSGLKATIAPAVDIKRVQDVMVITDFFGKLPLEEASE